MSNFHPLEVVGRGSETQLQVGDNLNSLIQRFKGYTVCDILLNSASDLILVMSIFININTFNHWNGKLS